MSTLQPLLDQTHAVDWWFAFKFNDSTFPGNPASEPAKGLFGGSPTAYPKVEGFCLSYAVASSANPTLQMGPGSLGASLGDPLGATYNQIYNGNCFYVVWNDQFTKKPATGAAPAPDPLMEEGGPAGHSKGILAWDATGNGVIIQVSTPCWPGSGSAKHPRVWDGNTLGCVKDDDVMVSQHFFSLKLSPADVASVIEGLVNASVVTKPSIPQIANIGGPAPIQKAAAGLGAPPAAPAVLSIPLSTGVTLISKPSSEQVAPWQLVSAKLGGIPLRVANWWADPYIYSTTAATAIGFWDPALGRPGPVDIAVSGTWKTSQIGLTGVPKPIGNHAKVGVSTDATKPYCIFGDMNQQGVLTSYTNAKGEAVGPDSSQNGRGGLFFALQNQSLNTSLAALLKGASAPLAQANGKPPGA